MSYCREAPLSEGFLAIASVTSPESEPFRQFLSEYEALEKRLLEKVRLAVEMRAHLSRNRAKTMNDVGRRPS